MDIYLRPLNLRTTLLSSGLFAAITATACPLPGEEPPTRSDRHATSENVQLERTRPVSESESVASEARRAMDLAAQLRELTDQQLLAVVRGGEVPPDLAKAATAAKINQALLLELSRRLDKRTQAASGRKSAAEASGEPTPAADASASPATNSTADRPPKPPEVKLDSVTVEACTGSPANIAMMQLKFLPGHGPIHFPDQPLTLNSSENRARYVAFDSSYQTAEHGHPWQLDQVRAYFLMRGDKPAELAIVGLEGVDSTRRHVTLKADPERHRQLFDSWWNKFSEVPEDWDTEQRTLKETLLDILSQRLNVPGPWPKVTSAPADDSFNLEKQFERAVGMLFGIESVKLAMQADETLTESMRREPANQAIPAEPRVLSVNLPSFREPRWIEPISMRVPQECFYLRTGNLSNYRRFREFLLGWGGSLDDIVATRSLRHQTRSRIEHQLAVDPQQLASGEIDKLVSDMALVGCDPLFSDGAAVGIIFEARDAVALNRLIKTQRGEAKRGSPNVSEHRVDVGRHIASLIASDDNRIRSFYAIDGDYHIITNSRSLLERFFAAGDGDRPLGTLREFRYARSKNQLQDRTLAFLYLSDPFFQNLISPSFRIELTRRQQAKRELQQLEMARLVAASEGVGATSIDALIDARLLPDDFAIRPDGSRPVLSGKRTIDSLRGAMGSFLPICDVSLHSATATEVSSYQNFLRKYNAQWRRIDPVTVVFSHRGSAPGGLQRVGLEIMITPYARQRYANLVRYLAPSSTRRVAPVEGDLLSVDTAIHRFRGGQPHLLYLGLRDDRVPFRIDNGQVVLSDGNTSFAGSRSYAAISPHSTAVLRLLASVLDPNSSGSAAQPVPAANSVASSRPRPPQASPAGHALFLLGWTIGTLGKSMGDLVTYSNRVSSSNGWTVVSSDPGIRHDTSRLLSEERISQSTQVRMRMDSLNGSQVEPYIQAYTYLASRRASAGNAAFLNAFADWTNLPAAEARDEAERLLGAELHCPLGGEFELHPSHGQQRWVSSSWLDPSVFAVSDVPEAWKFPFLDWARGLDLRFELDATTLRAEIDLLIRSEAGNRLNGPPQGMKMANVK